VKDAANPETVEVLANSIIEISDAFRKLKDGPLTQRAIVTLLQDGIGVSKITRHQIELVLDNLPRLRGWYVQKPKQ
jgi:hypothetical protein